jgi:hypothetical protein
VAKGGKATVEPRHSLAVVQSPTLREGRQPKPILPSGDNSETNQRPSLRREALRASVKMCWSNAEAIRLRILPGRVLRYG